ncbi:MAG: enoyl-CoA hydratase/isomerase family protein [Novosphingobium sp.]
MTTDILFERQADGAVVTLNRPDVRNALTPGMIAALADFLREVRADPAVRYLLIQGTGDHFSAGGDVAAYAQMLDQPPAQLSATFERRVRGNVEAFLELASLPIPVISLVRGAAAGAGLSLILASDFVLASEDALMVFAQPRIGLPLDLAMTYLLPRVVGSKAARKLALTGARVTADVGHALGIIDEVYPKAELPGALAALLKSLREVAPKAAGRSKTLLLESETRSLIEQMEAEIRAIGQCCAEPDFAEGVTAFIEKRRARFGLGRDG